MRTYAAKIMAYYKSLIPPTGLPPGVSVLFPYSGQDTLAVMKTFFNTFYGDTNKRKLILGINPGRFGAGTTGINFTGPRQLKTFCGIDHPFKDQSELSAEFIYEMIMSYGSPASFYGDYFIGAVSPLGYVRNGVNMNYYDDKELLTTLLPFIINNIQELTAMGFESDKCFCIGGDKNFKVLSDINDSFKFFKTIIPLPHPRFIMQYKRKSKDEYIREYINILKN